MADFYVDDPNDPLEAVLASLVQLGESLENYAGRMCNAIGKGLPKQQNGDAVQNCTMHCTPEASESRSAGVASVKERSDRPGMVSVLLVRAGDDRSTPLLTHRMQTVDASLSVGRLVHELRKKQGSSQGLAPSMKRMPESTAIFLFTKPDGPGGQAQLIPMSWTLSQLDDGKGPIRIYYSSESVFGFSPITGANAQWSRTKGGLNRRISFRSRRTNELSWAPSKTFVLQRFEQTAQEAASSKS